jgi:uncharacterized protein with HEPN domain
VTRRKEEGFSGNGGQFTKKTTPEANVELTPELVQRDHRTLEEFIDFAALGARLVARGRDAYDSDEMPRLAGEAILHRIGETVARLSDELTMAHQQVNWRAMKGMRNIVTHEYGAIDHSLLWNSLSNDLPREAAEVRKIIGE